MSTLEVNNYYTAVRGSYMWHAWMAVACWRHGFRFVTSIKKFQAINHKKPRGGLFVTSYSYLQSAAAIIIVAWS